MNGLGMKELGIGKGGHAAEVVQRTPVASSSAIDWPL